MMAIMMFSGVAGVLVYLAGRKDAARDPRLTGVVLALLAVFPPMVLVLPKFEVLPASVGHGIAVVQGVPWVKWIAWTWVAGFGIAAIRLGIAAHGLAKWRDRSRLIQRLGRIEVRELHGLKGPVAAGVFRPTVFVPEAWNGWPESIRSIVLDHETAHHDRHDPLWRWMAEIAVAVNWFNPVVWWMARRLSMQCEYACDASVLRKGVPAGDYAMLLCDLAEDSIFRGPAMAMAERASLEQRVIRLAKVRHPRSTGMIFLMICFAIVSGLVLAATGSKTNVTEDFSTEEVRTRWAADPFPGESGGGL